MPKIVCKETNCVHNCCSQCLKESIKVSKNAFCHSFDGKNDGLLNEKKEKAYMETSMEFEAKQQERQYISCQAKKCIYNENNGCVKSSIEVKSKDFGAKCISYNDKE